MAIVNRCSTCGDFAGAIDAAWSSVSDAASVAAGVTVVDIVAAVDFASVAVIEVTVEPWCGARRDLAAAAVANRSSVCDLALNSTGSAIVCVCIQVCFAPVTVSVVTIIEARVTAGYSAAGR